MSSRARALMHWTAITLTLLATASLVITAIHPDFNHAVTLTLLAASTAAWIRHNREAADARLDAARRDLEERHRAFIDAVDERLRQWGAEGDQRAQAVTEVKDLARMLLEERYPTAQAAGGDEPPGADRPRLTVIKM